MTDQFKLKGLKLEKISIAKTFRLLRTQPEFQAYMEQQAKRGEDALKASIEENSGSVTGRTAKQQDEAKRYFASNVKSRVQKGRLKPYVAVRSVGNNAVDYEAEHGNLPKTINKLKGGV